MRTKSARLLTICNSDVTVYSRSVSPGCRTRSWSENDRTFSPTGSPHGARPADAIDMGSARLVASSIPRVTPNAPARCIRMDAPERLYVHTDRIAMETDRWGMRRAGDGPRAWVSPDWDGGAYCAPVLGS